jgi:hypothetical protein
MEPLLGVRDKAHSPVAVIGHVKGRRLTAYPSLGGSMELLKTDLTVCGQGEIVDEDQQVLGDETKRTFCAPLSRTMSKIAKALVQERGGPVPLDRAGALVQLMEHSRSSWWHNGWADRLYQGKTYVA